MSLIKHYANSPFFDRSFVEVIIAVNSQNYRNSTNLEFSTRRINLKSTELLIEIVKRVGGDVYISGMGGKKYMEEEKFEKERIEIGYFEFKPFEYLQR